LFDKSRVWKAFIEFENSGSALFAKNQLDGQSILPTQIKINVYFSELQKVQFQNKNYRGKGFLPSYKISHWSIRLYDRK